MNGTSAAPSAADTLNATSSIVTTFAPVFAEIRDACGESPGIGPRTLRDSGCECPPASFDKRLQKVAAPPKSSPPAPSSAPRATPRDTARRSAAVSPAAARSAGIVPSARQARGPASWVHFNTPKPYPQARAADSVRRGALRRHSSLKRGAEDGSQSTISVPQSAQNGMIAASLRCLVFALIPPQIPPPPSTRPTPRP